MLLLLLLLRACPRHQQQVLHMGAPLSDPTPADSSHPLLLTQHLLLLLLLLLLGSSAEVMCWHQA
jgi:hypothetical protein